MDFSDLCSLRVEDISDRDCTLLVWTTSPFLERCFEMIRAWNSRIIRDEGKEVKSHLFRYKSKIEWAKVGKNGRLKPGTGHHARGCSEPLLIFQRGNAKSPVKGVGKIPYGVVMEPVGRHSEKPMVQYTIAEGYMGRYIEVFARPNGQIPREGWTFIGQEITGLDISDDIKRLSNSR